MNKVRKEIKGNALGLQNTKKGRWVTEKYFHCTHRGDKKITSS